MPVADDAEGMVITVTMADVKEMTCDFITPAVAASVLKMDVGRLIGYAKEGQLPFPVQISGNRVKISRKGFLECYGYGDPEEKPEDPQIAKLEKELHNVNVALAAMNMMLMGILHAVAPEHFDSLQEKILSVAKEELK